MFFTRAFFVATLLLLFTAFPAFALELQYPNIPGFGDLDMLVKSGAPLSFPQIIQFIYALALWLAGLIALVALIYAGIIFAVASGNPAKRREAQQRLAGIALGLMILFSAFLILRTINPDLTRISARTFAICKPAGTVECSAPFFPPLEPPPPDIPSKTPPFKLFLAKNLAVGPPLFFNPSDILEVSADQNLPADWDNKAHYIRMQGNGKATFLDASDYLKDPPPWLELAHHESLGYTCVSGTFKSDASIDIVPCTSFFNDTANQVVTLDGTFVDLGKFCIDDSCPILGGDRFEDNISSISFKEAGSGLPSGCPVKGCRMLSTFAQHLATRCGGPSDPRLINCGVDVQSSEGEGGEVYATLAGEVRIWNLGMGGIGLDIYNNDRTVSVYYSHLLDVVVSTGSKVSVGQLVGHQDRTGNAKTLPIEASHVHYSVIVDGVGVDPELFSLK